MKRIATLLLLVAGCRANPGPELPSQMFVLTSIAGQPLPAPWAPNPDVGTLAYADTLRLYQDNTGSRRTVNQGDTPGSRVTSESAFTWTQSGSQMTITFICGPDALCIAAPHFVGTIGVNGDFTVTQSFVTRQPLVYRYLYPPD
ncbi:MAG TPA: hypothetical protein VFO55_13315 [Gemmatimonadaceae bacterium]|nr:hypothetical protein [Gemmatimonadaceae bacterium]